MTQHITVVAQGGLCNRLRVVLSALRFSEKTGCSVRVEWAKIAECYADFNELFEPLDNNKFSITSRHWWNTPVERRNLHLPALIRLPLYSKQIKNYHPQRHPSLSHLCASHNRIYLSTGYALMPYPQEMAQRLQPTAELRQRIKQITKQFAAKMIGVHIRRTDNAVSINESPIECFVQAMRQELDKDCNTAFYVATDDISVRNLLIKEFPQHIHFQQIENCVRSTVDGIKDAVVDLYCLAQTDKIIGSYWSSFSDAAAEIGGIPLCIARRETSENVCCPQ